MMFRPANKIELWNELKVVSELNICHMVIVLLEYLRCSYYVCKSVYLLVVFMVTQKNFIAYRYSVCLHRKIKWH